MSRKTIKSRMQEFEDLKHTDAEGVEYWLAREIMPHLGYTTWENFHGTIRKAMISVESTDLEPDLVFRKITNHYKSRNRYGKFDRKRIDYEVTRYGCYVIAQNGDSSKEAIASAQAYFAVQTIRQEQYDQLPADAKRLYVRRQVVDRNKLLNKAASSSGVTDYVQFHDAGYQGLYGMRNYQVANRKGLGKDKLLDRAGTTELAANLFRVTQTEEQLNREVVKGKRIGQHQAGQVHQNVGREVRGAIEKIGGTLPEDLPPEPHIKEIEKRLKAEDKRRLTPAEKPTKLSGGFAGNLKRMAQAPSVQPVQAPDADATELWERLLVATKTKYSVSVCLQKTKPKRLTKARFTLVTQSEFFQTKLMAPAMHALVEETVEKILGWKVQVVVNLES